ncbi:hypothetical protein CEQ90_05935 [Lewinellaceae bacterium SD302]|nr:hypothetical protein CEQ90_05935 [Lewinellaceae bacterium SD302]
MLRILSLVLLFGLFPNLSAQEDFELNRKSPPVSIDKSQLNMPWVGGLNNPQPHMTDLDGDGDTELYLFDRQGHRHLGFQREENGSFIYEPELTKNFPDRIPHWVVMRDFDGDGIDDIFGHSDTLVSGILVYKGFRDADGFIDFERMTFGEPLPILYFEQSNGSRIQIFVSTIDYPEIADLDCDGDMDILTFNSNGGYVELFANQSVELGYGTDSLIFDLVDNCYGGIYESGLSPEVTLAGGPDECATPFNSPTPGPDPTPGGARHAGSTLLTLDHNQDGKPELLLGDVSFTEVVMLINDGDCDDAWFSDQELDFPAEDVPVDIIFFPASFYTDVNQDGTSDFIAAPNQFINAEDRKVFWYYENVGQEDAPDLRIVDSLFLVRDMIDMGTGAMPVAFDVNNDGLQDLIVSNRQLFTSSISFTDSRLVVFLNVGTETEPAFEQTQLDYLDMSEFLNTTTEFAPAFGDLNGDGRPDALVGGQDGKLFFFPNVTNDNGPQQFGTAIYPFMDIDVSQSARPFIVDLNRDGLNDLVIGNRSGRIAYFQNIGTADSPQFSPDMETLPNQIQLGGIDTRNVGSSLGYSSPIVIDRTDGYILLTGTNRGQIEAYGNIDGNLEGNFTELDLEVGDFRTGFRSELTAADFDNDGTLELIFGNGRGGLEYFGSEIPSEVTGIVDRAELDRQLKVFPNPASGTVNVLLEGRPGNRLQLYDINGRMIKELTLSPGEQQMSFSVRELPTGVYTIRLSHGSGSIAKKLVVTK